ncbi:MAG: hypothetical protein JWO64_3689 [Hyphomicrobiales bacterium]|nr:hypothetical protein [Hyphomicrobiales bacterium]
MRVLDFTPPKHAFAGRSNAGLVWQHFAGLLLIAACSSIFLGDVEARAAVLGPKQVEASVQQCLGSFLRRNPRVSIATSKVVEVRLLKRGESGPGTALKMANAYSYTLPAATSDLSAINIDIIWKPRRTQALTRSARFSCIMSDDGRVLSVHSIATSSP